MLLIQSKNVLKKYMSTATTPISIVSNNLPSIPKFENLEDERLHRKQRLAAGFRIFAELGYDEGVAGHITARDPIDTNSFWVNPFGVHFSLIKVSDLIRVSHDGKVIEGKGSLNNAAFAIHSTIHKNRPNAVAAAHAHSKYGKLFSIYGRIIEPLTQDACAFYNDISVYNDYGGNYFHIII